MPDWVKDLKEDKPVVIQGNWVDDLKKKPTPVASASPSPAGTSSSAERSTNPMGDMALSDIEVPPPPQATTAATDKGVVEPKQYIETITPPKLPEYRKPSLKRDLAELDRDVTAKLVEQASKEDDKNRLRQSAFDFAAKGKPAAANAVADVMLQKHPDDPYAHEIKAYSLESDKDYVGATKELTNAIAKYPDNEYRLNLIAKRAMLSQKAGLNTTAQEDADEYLRQIQSANGDQQRAATLANMYKIKGDKAKADYWQKNWEGLKADELRGITGKNLIGLADWIQRGAGTLYRPLAIPAEMIAEGGKKIYENYDPRNPAATNVPKVLSGAIDLGFGALMSTPAGVVFNSAITAGELVGAGEVTEWAFAPVSKILALNGVDESKLGDWTKLGIQVGNLLPFMLAMHGKGALAKKFANKEPLNGAEIKAVDETVATITPEETAKVVELANKFAKDNKDAAEVAEAKQQHPEIFEEPPQKVMSDENLAELNKAVGELENPPSGTPEQKIRTDAEDVIKTIEKEVNNPNTEEYDNAEKKLNDIINNIDPDTDWRISNGKVEFYSVKESTRSALDRGSIVNANVYDINSDFVYKVGDNLAYDNGTGVRSAMVTRVSTDGKILDLEGTPDGYGNSYYFVRDGKVMNGMEFLSDSNRTPQDKTGKRTQQGTPSPPQPEVITERWQGEPPVVESKGAVIDEIKVDETNDRIHLHSEYGEILAQKRNENELEVFIIQKGGGFNVSDKFKKAPKEYGVKLYERLIDEAKKRGFKAIYSSPGLITKGAASVYEKLSGLGYKIEKDPNIVVGEHGAWVTIDRTSDIDYSKHPYKIDLQPPTPTEAGKPSEVSTATPLTNGKEEEGQGLLSPGQAAGEMPAAKLTFTAASGHKLFHDGNEIRVTKADGSQVPATIDVVRKLKPKKGQPRAPVKYKIANPEYQKVVNEYVNSVDLDRGESAFREGEQYPDDFDAAAHVAENSTNPREIAETFLSESNKSPFVEGSVTDEAIDRHIGFVVGGEKTNSPGSFRNISDKANVTQGMRLNWFRDDGMTLDEVARLASAELGEGETITPNDVAEFIIKYPHKGDYQRKNVNPNLENLKIRFETVTGMPLNDAMINRVRMEQAERMPTTKRVVGINSKIPEEILNSIAENDVTLDNLDRVGAFLGWEQQWIDNARKYLENENQEKQAPVRGEEGGDVRGQGEQVDRAEEPGPLEKERRARIEEIDGKIPELEKQRKELSDKVDVTNANIELPLEVAKKGELIGAEQSPLKNKLDKIDRQIKDLQDERAVLVSKEKQTVEADRAQQDLFNEPLPEEVGYKTVEQLQTEFGQGKWKGRMKEYNAAMEEARRREAEDQLNDNEIEGDGTEYAKRPPKPKETGVGKPEPKQAEPEEKGARAKDWIKEDQLTNDKLGAIEFPELVALVKELTGIAPVVRYLGKALGKFAHTEGGKGYVKLSKGLFKFGNEKELGKVIAHEIGHLFDWLPDKTMKRGNLLGRLASLKDYYKTLLKETPKSIDNLITDKERARIRRQAEKELKEEYKKGITEIIEEVTKEIPVYEEAKLTPEDILKIWKDTTGKPENRDLYEYIASASSATKRNIVAQALKGIVDEAIQGKFGKRLGTKTVTEKIRRIIYPKEISAKNIHERFRELLKDEINKRRLFDLITIKDELKKLTQWWNPFNENADGEYTRYRYSGKELYAEAMSVLLNNPKELADRAPWFNRAFFNHLGSKPEVKAAYESLQELIKDPEKVYEERAQRSREGYKEAREKVLAETQKNKKIFTVDSFVRSLVSEISPLIKRLPNASEYGKLSQRQTVRDLVERMKFVNNKYAALIYDVNDNVLKPLEKIGLNSDDLGLILEYSRNLAPSVIEKPAPGGMQAQYSIKQLQHIMNKYTPEQQAIIKQSVGKFHDIVWNILQEAKNEGLYSDELWNKVFVPNKDNYSTRQIVDYATNYVSAGIHELKGSLKQIRNPMESTVAKMFAIINATTRSKAAKSVKDALAEFHPDEITEAKPDIRNGVHIGQFQPQRNKYALGYYENGVYKGAYVDKYFENVFKNMTPQDVDIVTGIFRTFNKGFKPLVTSWNPGFAFLFNVIKDSRRTVTNLYAISAKHPIDPKTWIDVRMKMLRRFIPAAREGAKLYEGHIGMVIREMMDEGVFDYRTGILSRYNEGNSESIDAIASRIGMGNNMMSPLEAKVGRNKVWRELKKISDWYFKWGSALEIGTKVNAYEYLIDKGFSKEAAAFYVRNYTGTPNYKEGGRISKNVNEYLPFSTVIIQGLRNDFSIASRPNTAGAYWFDQTVGTVIPAMFTGLAAAGIFGDDIKKLYGNISNYYLYNYLSIPLGKSETGKTQHLTIPMDEVSRLIYAITFGITKSIASEELPTAKEVQQVGQIGIGFIPSPSPMINVVSAWNDYLVKGKNPTDEFRGGDVIKQSHFNAGGWPATKDMISWSLSRSGGSGIMSLFDYDPIANTTTEFAVKNIPIMSRIYRESSTGDADMLRQINEENKRKAGKESYKQENVVNDAVLKFFKDHPDEKIKSRIDFHQYSRQMSIDYFGHYPPRTREEKDDYDKMNKELRLKLASGIKGEHQQWVRALIYAFNNDTKVDILNKYKGSHSDAEYLAIKKYLLANKIVSQDVIRKVH